MLRGFCILLFLNIFNLTIYAQDIDLVRKHIDTLCSPAMHGRGYVNKGDQIAATYIADQFKEYQLKKFKTSYFQYFNFDINTFPHAMLLSADGKKFIPGKDYIINPISGKGKGSVKIRLLDTAIFYSKEVQEQFLLTKNKRYAFVYESKNFSKLTELPLEFITKIHEAKCVIELEEKKLTMSMSANQFSHPFFQLKKEKFNPETKKIKFHTDAVLEKNYRSQNVIGYIEGKTKPDSFIVISAHYDHLGRMGKYTYFPGANDNASGVSMMLELARHYSQAEYQPVYSMVFMAFGAEEAGLIGSKYYTENPFFPLSNIKLMLNMDLLGTGDDGMMVVNGSVFKKEFELLSKINNEEHYLPEIKKRGVAANSDHYFFSQKGVHAFFFYTLGGIDAYHDVNDVPETLPLTKFKEVFQLITKFIERSSEI
jgi:aminopeptidase YwaD